MNKYRNTMAACYVGYIVQAVVNNLLPLLFVIFKEHFGISTQKLGSLILINFVMQLFIDLAASRFGDKLGYRRALVLAHLCAGLGLILAGVLPIILPSAYLGLILATFFYAIGGGLIEVMVSPMMDAMPSDNKSAAMSFLHSFYCWGQVAVVLLSTVFIKLVGEQYWYILPVVWSLVPLFNVISFLRVPMPEMLAEEERVSLKELFRNKMFLCFVLLMISAGSSELAMSQWASYFAEEGLGVSKFLGDLLGPCAFAVFMGIARVIYGIFGSRIPLKKAMLLCALLCVGCYLLAGLSRNPYFALLGCAVCGFSVGVMWPGTLSLAGAAFKGGTAMFGILALSGDIGCSIGPWLTGIVSGMVEHSERLSAFGDAFGWSAQQTGIKLGLLLAVVFPIITVFSLLGLKSAESQRENLEKQGIVC